MCKSKFRIIVLLSCLFLSSKYTTGQEINGYCKHIADSLIKTGIDTVIYYQPFVSPLTHEANECCMIYERRYLIWKKETKFYILKLYDYYYINHNSKGKNINVVEFKDTSGIFLFLQAHYQNVVSDTLLPAKFKYFNGKTEIIEDFSILHVDDDGYTQVYILVKGKSFQNG